MTADQDAGPCCYAPLQEGAVRIEFQRTVETRLVEPEGIVGERPEGIVVGKADVRVSDDAVAAASAVRTTFMGFGLAAKRISRAVMERSMTGEKYMMSRWSPWRRWAVATFSESRVSESTAFESSRRIRSTWAPQGVTMPTLHSRPL